MTECNLPVCVVLMATYNGEQFIKQQVESIFAQEDVNVYIFYRDDGSTDNTKVILQQFDRVFEVQDDFPIGLGSAANFLALISSFKSVRSPLHKVDFVFLSDQDDVWFPDKMRNAIKFLRGDYKAYSGSVLRANAECDPGDTKYINKVFADLRHTSFCRSPGPGFTFAFRADAWYLLASSNYLGKFFPYSNYYVRWHDWLLFAACVDLGINWYIDKNVFAYYRIHSNNDTGSIRNIYSGLRRVSYLLSGQYFCEMIKVNRFRSDVDFLAAETSLFKFIKLLYRVEYDLIYKISILVSYSVFRVRKIFQF